MSRYIACGAAGWRRRKNGILQRRLLSNVAKPLRLQYCWHETSDEARRCKKRYVSAGEAYATCNAIAAQGACHRRRELYVQSALQLGHIRGASISDYHDLVAEAPSRDLLAGEVSA